MIDSVLGSTVGNLLLLVVVPFGAYLAYHRLRHRRALREAFARAGFRLGEARFTWYCVLASVPVVAALMIWPPSPETFGVEGSAQQPFVDAGLGGSTFVAVFLYGVIQTGFCEELLFRGMIAGSLGRRMSTLWANLIQAGIFLIPHLAILVIMPSAWPILIVVSAGALFTGWVRIRSGSFFGPWILHAAANVTTALLVASA